MHQVGGSKGESGIIDRHVGRGGWQGARSVQGSAARVPGFVQVSPTTSNTRLGTLLSPAQCASHARQIVACGGRKPLTHTLGCLVQPDEARSQHAQRGDAVRGRGRAAPLLGQPARRLLPLRRLHVGAPHQKQVGIASCSFPWSLEARRAAGAPQTAACLLYESAGGSSSPSAPFNLTCVMPVHAPLRAF